MTPAPKSRKYEEEEENLLDFDKINDRYQSSELTDRTRAVDLRGYFGNTYKTDPQLQGLGAYSAAQILNHKLGGSSSKRERASSSR